MAWTSSGRISAARIHRHIEGLANKLEQGSSQSVLKAIQNSWQELESGNVVTSRQWCQMALDYSWEQLNMGNWEDVGPVWREVYSTAALLKALGLAREGENGKALETLDRGILLGAPILDSALHSLATFLTASIHSENRSTPATKQSMGRSEISRGGKRKIVFRNYKPINSDGEKGVFHLESLKRPSTGINVHDLASRTANVPLVNPDHRIPLVYLPSLEVFRQNYMSSHTPVVISGALDTWPAYSARKWRYTYSTSGNHFSSSYMRC